MLLTDLKKLMRSTSLKYEYNLFISIFVLILVPNDNRLNSIGYSTIIMSMSNIIHLETFTAIPRYVFLTYVAK
jgi:hypothetical protein